MSRIVISCTDQELEILEAGAIASGGVNEVTVVFRFGPKWAGFVKTGVFYAGGDADNAKSVILDGEDSCKVPWEVMVDSGTLSIGVFGVKGDVIRTSNMVRIKVKQGTPRVETVTGEPTPSVYAQLLTRLYGVHIGSEEPTDRNIMAWINPEEEVGGRTLLWKNTGSSMGQERIDIPGIMDYDRIEIVHVTDTESVAVNAFPLKWLRGHGGYLSACGGGYLYERAFAISDVGIEFHGGYYYDLRDGRSVESEEACVPMEIYGIKEGWI